MATAGRSEGPRAPLFYCAACVALVLAGVGTTAFAQDVASDELAACAEISDASERLACFEALVPAGRPAADVRRAPPDEPSPTPPTAPAATAAESAPGVAETAAPDDGSDAFGEEQLDRDDEEPPVLAATVVDVSRNWDGALDFHMESGQVWRQIEPRRFQYPKDGDFNVEISKGMMGEYRLRVDGESRMVRIRRVK